jgi:hypothetical protein
MKNEVESYLVRIYRRGTLKTGIAGTVEIIAKEKTKAFIQAAGQSIEARAYKSRTQ